MPGAGSLIAANFLYSKAAQDGTALGTVSRNIPNFAFMKSPNANFDPLNRPADASHDQCSRNLGGCQLRFPGQVLPARFFPGVGKVR